jgi:hypothetical protein
MTNKLFIAEGLENGSTIYVLMRGNEIVSKHSSARSASDAMTSMERIAGLRLWCDCKKRQPPQSATTATHR